MAVVTLGWSERAAACEPARAAGDVDRLPPPWRQAFDALLLATADPGQPWGCPDAVLALDIEESGAILRVMRLGARPMERRLLSPDDVVPMGKAMLARPLPPEPPPPPLPDRKITTPPPEEPPRAFVDGAATFRYVGTGRPGLLAAGGGARGAVPFGPWAAALWTRYTVMVSRLSQTFDVDYAELTIGGSVSYAAVEDPVRLTVGLFGALAVVDMETEGPSPSDKELDVESGAVDGRVGTELRLSIPLSGIWHFLVSVDADVAPASISRPDRKLDPLLPPLPAFTIGLSSGIEVAIP